jgi:GH25 family lysozyme M1 (1,4-beta-N-acetylmuramidase)
METTRASRIRPEVVLGIFAGLAAILVAVMAVLCLPYYFGNDDPEPHVHQSGQHLLPPTEATEAPTEPEETMEPTIPPELNPYGRLDFQYDRHNYLYCLRQDSWPGVDVSAFQGTIDWEKVAASGIRYAMVRLGYRGYGKAGRMVADEYAQANLQGARDAGLQVGAYFFSQALSIEEADEEIEFMMEILGDFPLDMPIILDWEQITVEGSRSVNMDARTLTDIQLHFCKTMTEMGYQPMIYFNWYQSTRLMYLQELEEYPFWLALYQDRMTYPYRVEMWQYTDKGRVPGIQGDVDINVYMP